MFFGHDTCQLFMISFCNMNHMIYNNMSFSTKYATQSTRGSDCIGMVAPPEFECRTANNRLINLCNIRAL